MIDVAAVRAGLAANMNTLATVRQVNPYWLGNPTHPSLSVFHQSVDYDLAHGRGLDRETFIVQGVVGGIADIGAQKLLDTWMASSGSNSVKQAIEKDRTLGGAVGDSRVVSATVSQYQRPDGQVMLTADWLVEVISHG